jgi:hypothetical protein
MRKTIPSSGRFAALMLTAALCTTAHAGKPAPITPAEWKNASSVPLAPGEIDRLIDAELKAAGVKPAPRTTDEQFIRRVYLDVTGKLPSPPDIAEFVKDTDSKKRSKLIDRLLDSGDYASHWAAYWREVMSARQTDFRGRLLARPFETWMTEQIKKNRHWDEIARELLTFQGEARYADVSKAGPAFFLGSHFGADAVAEQTAETSRIFLGVQINCAQCHDHPFDAWKREQFHELAAYFARVRPRPLREEQRQVGITMTAFGRFGEYRMPDKSNPRPRSGKVMNPRFLDGTSPGRGLSDEARRKSLADSVTSKNTPWFSAAFVNRIWGELMGQSFCMPVDDLGPQKEAVQGAVLARLAGGFRGTDHDIKALFRVILNSETYQRQSRQGEVGEHLQFAAVSPTRLRASALWESVQHALGPMTARGFGGGGAATGRRGFGRGGVEGIFKQEFSFDPSLKPEDVEGSIPQSLLLMNNPQVQQRISARGNTTLSRILDRYPRDEEAVMVVYLQTLARKPTEREKSKCLALVRKASSRGDAYEDILWALLNSTEFQTKR